MFTVVDAVVCDKRSEHAIRMNVARKHGFM